MADFVASASYVNFDGIDVVIGFAYLRDGGLG